MLEKDDQNKPQNLVEINSSMFVIRTQAGYRKLLKKIQANECGVLYKDGKHYPRFYPCVCKVHSFYMGYEGIRLTFSGIEAEIEKLQRTQVILQEQLVKPQRKS